MDEAVRWRSRASRQSLVLGSTKTGLWLRRVTNQKLHRRRHRQAMRRAHVAETTPWTRTNWFGLRHLQSWKGLRGNWVFGPEPLPKHRVTSHAQRPRISPSDSDN